MAGPAGCAARFSSSDTLSLVRSLRVWLLVLLAVLLPIRGAMAAAMVCSPAMGGTPAAQAGHAATTGLQAGSPGRAHDHCTLVRPTQSTVAAAATMAAADNADPAGAPAQDGCNLCAAACAVPPLPSAPARMAEPADLKAVAPPGVDAPAPSFVSDGQERPPRST